MWMRAIEDTLDEEVDESVYDDDMIQRVFGIIEKDQMSPAERARMKDEYSHQQLLEKERETLAEAQRIATEAQRREAEAQRIATEAQAEIAALRARLQALENGNGSVG
jgi:hypothetical protein